MYVSINSFPPRLKWDKRSWISYPKETKAELRAEVKPQADADNAAEASAQDGMETDVGKLVNLCHIFIK